MTRNWSRCRKTGKRRPRIWLFRGLLKRQLLCNMSFCKKRAFMKRKWQLSETRLLYWSQIT